MLVGALTEEQKHALCAHEDRPLKDVVAELKIPSVRLEAVNRALSEICLEDMVQQYKGLKGEEAKRFREEVSSFRECQRMAATAGKQLSFVKFLVMRHLALLSDIDGVLGKFGVVHKAREYMGKEAPPVEVARAETVLNTARRKTDRVSSQKIMRPAVATRRQGHEETLPEGNQWASKLLYLREMARQRIVQILVVIVTVLVLLSVGRSAVEVVVPNDPGLFRCIDFSDFSSPRNRKQHLRNLENLYSVLKVCRYTEDEEGAVVAKSNIIEYIATMRKKDPAFEKEDPDTFKACMAYLTKTK